MNTIAVLIVDKTGKFPQFKSIKPFFMRKQAPGEKVNAKKLVKNVLDSLKQTYKVQGEFGTTLFIQERDTLWKADFGAGYITSSVDLVIQLSSPPQKEPLNSSRPRSVSKNSTDKKASTNKPLTDLKVPSLIPSSESPVEKEVTVEKKKDKAVEVEELPSPKRKRNEEKLEKKKKKKKRKDSLKKESAKEENKSMKNSPISSKKNIKEVDDPFLSLTKHDLVDKAFAFELRIKKSHGHSTKTALKKLSKEELVAFIGKCEKGPNEETVKKVDEDLAAEKKRIENREQKKKKDMSEKKKKIEEKESKKKVDSSNKKKTAEDAEKKNNTEEKIKGKSQQSLLLRDSEDEDDDNTSLGSTSTVSSDQGIDALRKLTEKKNRMKKRRSSLGIMAQVKNNEHSKSVKVMVKPKEKKRKSLLSKDSGINADLPDF
eukprot:maker-scaffold_1-snap-gene-8.6-mRNA-1 protein AED:0.01 eAED:0.01 QI:96/1/1/1/0.66/0.75/4/125/428